MVFLDKIIDLFRGYGAAQIIGAVVGILGLALALWFVLAYAATHHASWFSGLVSVVILVTVGLYFVDVLHDANVIFIEIALLIIITTALFSKDIRRDLFKLSVSGKNFLRSGSVDLTPEELHPVIEKIVKSCQTLSKSDTGALIVICPQPVADFVAESGTTLDAEISGELIETVFYEGCPLHDGAMLIRGDRIVSAGCYLTLTQKQNLPRELGTRHRAALGITENDPTVTAVVVSEETGIISVMHDGQMKRYMDQQTLTRALEIAFGISGSEKEFWSKDYVEVE